MYVSCEIAVKLKKNQGNTTYLFDHVKTLLNNLDKEWSLPEAILSAARRLKKELLKSSDEEYIIHGDLHRGNILSRGDSWVCIDPKGYIGSIYNEIWPFIHDPELEIPIVAKRLDLNELKLTQWCFLQSILSATWGLEDGIDTKNILRLSTQLFKMIAT